jgi:hypothetical protein
LFESKPTNCAIQTNPSGVRFLSVSHLSKDCIPHATLLNVPCLVNQSISDAVYLKAAHSTLPLSKRIPVPSNLELTALPTDPAPGETHGLEWAKVLAARTCIIAREYLDQPYGNKGCLIDFKCDRSLLTALRMLDEPTEGEDLTPLDCIDGMTDYCIWCEHLIVVISRWARCSALVASWIEKEPSIRTQDRRAAFASKLYFPDFRVHNRTARHYRRANGGHSLVCGRRSEQAHRSRRPGWLPCQRAGHPTGHHADAPSQSQQIFPPVKVYRLTISASASETPRLLGIEAADSDRSYEEAHHRGGNLYSTLFEYLTAFKHAHRPDPINLADRWLTPDVNSTLALTTRKGSLALSHRALTTTRSDRLTATGPRCPPPPTMPSAHGPPPSALTCCLPLNQTLFPVTPQAFECL